MQDHRVKTCFGILELEVGEVGSLFRLLDNGDGLVSFDEFLAGVMRLRGGSKQIDVVTLLYGNRRVLATVNSIKADMLKLLPNRSPTSIMPTLCDSSLGLQP